jgi:hypothetical protein
MTRDSEFSRRCPGTGSAGHAFKLPGVAPFLLLAGTDGKEVTSEA